jgi:genome maintenance exonuclease 1
MEFIHSNKYSFEELNTETINGKRHYVTPNGKYPSVTTVLGFFKARALKEWRERVGPEEANRITARATRRGTSVHKIAEDYLSNKVDFAQGHMPTNVQSFQTLRPILDKSIGEIYGLEVPLYSDELRVAGRTDCIGLWDGEPAIIDFKTSNKPKKYEWIDNYFEQGACYAKMFEERTKFSIKTVVILIAVDDNKPQVFIENADNYLQSAIRKIRNYEEIHSLK